MIRSSYHSPRRYALRAGAGTPFLLLLTATLGLSALLPSEALAERRNPPESTAFADHLNMS